MSMLTPPGMGGRYRITGSKYPRMRRPRNRRRIVLAAVAAAVALGLLGWGTVQLIDVFTADDDGSRKTTTASAREPECKPSPSAATAAKKLPAPAKIKVNVYNATPRAGLAKTTADELKKRGFVIGKVGNAPAEFDKKIPGIGMLLGAPAAADGPFTVLGAQLNGAKTQHDARTTKDVDLLLGTAFKTLNVRKDADRTLAVLTRPTPGAPC
ncbi:LytR C-terminal domain-containing protein [Streptomyces sp. NBC_01498]|uniref:LytR C-terminal domain-containing protein n=1 Tax=Streptomyces sp. NBC_01498 TaxID=2975870 RepID=UPI002E7B9EA7|nr:LytR C-terminal domain-containing protein [Streptomyces sp. NBC_01498]WTL25991.1 LytR C-terminal domain-containing protein [Streptomyces sp. NBC_01498]